MTQRSFRISQSASLSLRKRTCIHTAQNEKLQELLSQYDDPQQAAEEIVKSAQEGGSKDNITCIVLHVS